MIFSGKRNTMTTDCNMTINLEPLIVEKWLTPQIKALVMPHSENDKWLTYHDDFLLTSALYGQQIGK